MMSNIYNFIWRDWVRVMIMDEKSVVNTDYLQNIRHMKVNNCVEIFV